MKKFTFWLLAIIFTFIFGVAATLIYLKLFYPTRQISEAPAEVSISKNENDSANLPILAFCELANNPAKYDGKTVRLSARLYIGIEGSWFSDSNCGVDSGAVISASNKDVWQAIDKARARKKKEPWDIDVNLIVVGKFKNTIYEDGCCLTTPFQFEILKVEKASKVVE